MKAVVFTLGCKVNEVESAAIMASLEKLGLEVSAELSPADIFVLNTCAVTREAERKSRQLIARARKFNPDADIYVCGCASQKDAAPFEERNVTFVCGAGKKERVAEEIAKRLAAEYRCEPTLPKQVKTRAFIKIEDGCNNFCSYCIIPYLRGRVQSRAAAEIVAEAEAADSAEIVLTGINISAYSCGEEGLGGLIRALYGIKKRIRLGSLECNVITEPFLRDLQGLYDFAPQFHLSLQSGSDAVLKRMNRRYSRADYLEKCALIYRYFPDAAITTDIIAGFAGESDEDFNESLSIIGEAGLARVHAFAYSPREGTAAFQLKDVPADVKSARLHRLLQAGKTAEERYIGGCVGKNFWLIAEEFDGAYTCGYTENYIKTYVAGELAQGKKYLVTIKEIYADGALAVLA